MEYPTGKEISLMADKDVMKCAKTLLKAPTQKQEDLEKFSLVSSWHQDLNNWKNNVL